MEQPIIEILSVGLIVFAGLFVLCLTGAMLQWSITTYIRYICRILDEDKAKRKG